MHIEPIAYMEWAKLHKRRRINLSPSGMPERTLADLGLDPESLKLGGVNPYGHPELISALAARYRVPEKNILTTAGASQAIFMVCAALVDPGDRLLVEKPAYEPLLAVPRMLGAEILRLERRYEDGFGIDLDRYRQALASRPRLVVLTNLHTPSGVRLSQAELRRICSAAAEAGAMVFFDEIYLEYSDGGCRTTAFGLGDNVIVASSLTKVYGLGGLRCGWVFAPDSLVAALRRLVDHLNVEGVYLGEQISAAAFSRLDAWAGENRPLLKKNLELVRVFIRGEPKLSWVEPDSGIIGFPRIEAPVDGTRLAEILEESYDTTVVPGRFFEEPRHFRLGFGGAAGRLAEGLENIRRALASF
jgi:aspartate/methionine/tyrosine aminotransferase